ncbi:MAG: topoisomerase IIA [Solumvirus sp.]|uniref:DNA topoisomerase 2 n=1 Tax=Solumvirus sp. TaxID=2487773 RepID=A0A3G5AJM7_9VIRU|nr:MAG: topoisomerase IIA [Solumvirus sp.]
MIKINLDTKSQNIQQTPSVSTIKIKTNNASGSQHEASTTIIKIKTPDQTPTASIIKIKTPDQTPSSSRVNTPRIKVGDSKSLELSNGVVKSLISDTSKSSITEPPIYSTIKIKKDGFTASDYKKLNDRDHALLRPDNLIGSDQRVERQLYLLSTQDGTPKFEYATVDIPHALEQLFLEAITNAADAVNRTRRTEGDIDPGIIVVEATTKEIRVKNGGIPIPVEIHPEEKIYVPEMIFSHFKAGSNLGEHRTEAGMNAIGIKAVNVFSTKFSIDIYDHIRHKRYQQTWTDNMGRALPHVITSYDGSESSVEIIYSLDYPRLGYPKGEAPQEFINLIGKHCADVSFTSKVPVKFNNINFNLGNIKDYAKLIFGDKISKQSCVLHYEWPEGTKITEDRHGNQKSVDPNIMPIHEMIVVDTPDNPVTLSFINSLFIKNNGVHTVAALKSVASGIVDTVNYKAGVGNRKGDEKKKKTSKGKKKIVEVKSEKPLPKITMNDVYHHISIILSCRIVNPRFNSQSKDKLLSPIPKFTIAESTLKVMDKWDLVARLQQMLLDKGAKLMNKTHGRSYEVDKEIGDIDAINANSSNPNERMKCTLMIAEGKSAMPYISELINFLEGKRYYYGAIPIRGKLINVIKASMADLLNSKELDKIKEYLKLSETVDYSNPENIRNLRYGSVMIAADGDDDGKHITGLNLNNFFTRYKGLVESGYVRYLRTPHARAISLGHSNEEKVFYTSGEYKRWVDKVNPKEWTINYYKGLGSSNPGNVKQDAKDPWMIKFTRDSKAKESIDLAFDEGEERADARKAWILGYQEYIENGRFATQTVTEFINRDFIQYSVASIIRAIPSGLDGEKVVRRKVLWGTFSKWPKIYSTKNYKTANVGVFFGHIKEKTNYHHGQDSMCKTIIGMAQRYVGANNLPYLLNDGMFGTREGGGKNASNPRYIKTGPNWCMRFIYREEDKKLLSPQIIEGEKCEPKHLLPILPMHLINGVHGIATGFSVTIPAFSPVAVVTWLRAKIKGDLELPKLIPWYRGFTGEITVVDRRKPGVNGTYDNRTSVPSSPRSLIKIINTQKSEDERSNNKDEKKDEKNDLVTPPVSTLIKINIKSDQKKESKGNKYCAMIKGIWHQESNDVVVVTEIPINKSMNDYDMFLAGLKAEGRIRKYDAPIEDDKPYYRIYGMINPSTENLGLVSSISMSNMHLLNEEGRPIKHHNIESIITSFYEARLVYYEKRWRLMLENMKEQIKHKSDKMRYIELILEEKIEVRGRKKAELEKQVSDYKIDIGVIKETTTANLTKEEVEKLKEEVIKLEEEKKTLENTHHKQLWLTDLEEFEKEYFKYYPQDRPRDVKISIGGNINKISNNIKIANNTNIIANGGSKIKINMNK